jgi:hypothetical protein
MVETSDEHADSISSSVTEAETFGGTVLASSLSAADRGVLKLNAYEEIEIDNDLEERVGLLLAEQQDEKPRLLAPGNNTRTPVIWMGVNTLATIGIVSICDTQVEIAD